MSKRQVCSICGDTLGVYEPVFVVRDRKARATSLAREPHAGEDGSTVIHRGCAPKLSRGPRRTNRRTAVATPSQ